MSKLDFLVNACVQEYLWSIEDARIFVAEFERFMVIKRVKQDWQDKIITPAPIIDQVWRIAILHTAEYPVLCGKHMIHYSLMLENDSKRYNQTLETYESLFGEPANEIIWPRTIIWDSDVEGLDSVPQPVKKKRRASISSKSGSRKRQTSKTIQKTEQEKPQPVTLPLDEKPVVNSDDLVKSLLFLDHKSRSAECTRLDSPNVLTTAKCDESFPKNHDVLFRGIKDFGLPKSN